MGNLVCTRTKQAHLQTLIFWYCLCSYVFLFFIICVNLREFFQWLHLQQISLLLTRKRGKLKRSQGQTEIKLHSGSALNLLHMWHLDSQCILKTHNFSAIPSPTATQDFSSGLSDAKRWACGRTLFCTTTSSATPRLRKSSSMPSWGWVVRK